MNQYILRGLESNYGNSLVWADRKLVRYAILMVTD
jgi:hypothetical protein